MTDVLNLLGNFKSGLEQPSRSETVSSLKNKFGELYQAVTTEFNNNEVSIHSYKITRRCELKSTVKTVVILCSSIAVLILQNIIDPVNSSIYKIANIAVMSAVAYTTFRYLDKVYRHLLAYDRLNGNLAEKLRERNELVSQVRNVFDGFYRVLRTQDSSSDNSFLYERMETMSVKQLTMSSEF